MAEALILSITSFNACHLIFMAISIAGLTLMGLGFIVLAIDEVISQWRRSRSEF
jgi:hypothetical protein